VLRGCVARHDEPAPDLLIQIKVNGMICRASCILAA